MLKEKKITEKLKDISHSINNNIVINGARLHNLKNISVSIPRNKLIVVTGVSGSGKSSLTIDTLFAEGQRRYAESLSAYARQFMQRMNKPDVDSIKGLCPAIAIEQKVVTRTPRSTVGSMTEIYDYLRLLFARVGTTFSPISGNKVKKDDSTDVLQAISQSKPGDRIFILAGFKTQGKRNVKEELGILLQKGFSRIYVNGGVHLIDEAIKEDAVLRDIKTGKDCFLIIDRLVNKNLMKKIYTAFPIRWQQHLSKVKEAFF